MGILTPANRKRPHIRFKTRNYKTIDLNLDSSPIVKGFIPAPVHTQIKRNVHSFSYADDGAC